MSAVQEPGLGAAANDTPSRAVAFERGRVESLLSSLERMAGGDLEHAIAISPARDELDAIAHAVNVLAHELLYRLKQLQEAQGSLVQAGRLAALGEISSGLAHELNNPLTVIVGHLEMMGSTIRAHAGASPALAGLQGNLERMERNAQRMTLIIRHIMDFARQSAPAKKPVRLDEVIARAFILMNEQLRLLRIRTTVEVSDDHPATLGDELKLEQVIINLLSNARDAILEARGDRGGAIQVRCAPLSHAELEVVVADDGMGMSPEVLVKAFEPFFTTKAVGKGTGLGLSISHGIIEDHGGRICCKSEHGRGATFRIVLPRHSAGATGA